MTEPNAAFLGIEIGGTKIQLVVTDVEYKVLEHIKFYVGDIKKSSVILSGLKTRIKPLLTKHSIQNIGVGFGGPVNFVTGEIYKSFHVEGWERVNLKTWLQELTGILAFVDNDANIAALGEAILGAGKNYGRVFYITLGSGVGGGFVVDGEIYHGQEPGELEVGHLRLSKSGATLESSCSGWALNKKLEAYIQKETDSPLARSVHKNKTDCSKNLMAAIDQGDFNAKAILNATIDDLALGLSHVIHIVNPEIIIVGGGLSNLGGYLPSSITKFLPRYVMETMKEKLPRIVLSPLQESAVPLGAAVYGAIEKQRAKKSQD